MTDLENLDFLVKKANWRETRFQERALPGDPAPGQVIFRVDRFAFTANNISYASAGDMLGYWRFFPTDPTDEGWGRLPTMGYGDVVASAHPDVAVGTRCFGFYPMSKFLCIEPSSASATSIVDGAAHREGISPIYNQYSPVETDPLYSAEYEDEMILMRGLFMTSFLSEDALGENEMYGAEAVLISSASSKTSIALAACVAQSGRARAIGLTSEGNVEFVRSLGCYDEVFAYEAIPSMPANLAGVFVDMAGSDRVTRAIHSHFGENLRHSQRIGATHWEEPLDPADLPGPEPEFFFAPAQAQKRIADWGASGFHDRLSAGWTAFREASRKWLAVERGYGRESVSAVYLDTLEGRTRPDRGQVLSLWENEDAAAGR